MSRKSFSALSAIAFLALPTLAQPLPPGVQKKASMGGITEYDFTNGLKVLLDPDTANPKITVNVTYLVGSRHEGYGETGMAHLLEHMNFIETNTGRHIKKEIVDRGANWNGTTANDRTNYFETFPATDDNLQWALSLEADRMVDVKFTKQLLDTEMTVVRNEFERGENSPQNILRERVEATAYLWHNYGKTTIGSREDIEKVPIDRLAAFYRKYYRPDNAVLVITGRIDEAKTLSAVASTFGKIPRPNQPLDPTYTVEPPQDGERFVELRRVGRGQVIILAYHGPAAGHPDSAALQVLSGIMNGPGRPGRGGGTEEDGRLWKALVQFKLAEASSMTAQRMHDPGLIMLSANLNRDQSLDAARKALIDALADIAKTPPTKEEVDRVRIGLLRGLERSLADPQSLAMGALNASISQGDWRLMFLDHDRYEDVSPADVQRVAQTYFKTSNLTVGYYIPDAAPDRAEVPATPNLDTLLANYKSNVSVKHGESFDPTPANIESRVVRPKLANGMKVVVLSKQTAGERITADLDLRFGDETSLSGKNVAADFAAALIMRSGTKTRTRDQLQEELRKLDANVVIGGGIGPGGIYSANASLTAPAKNFAATMRLAVEMLKEPVYSSVEFDLMRVQRVKSLQIPPTEPTQIAAEHLQRHLSPFAKGEALYTPTREEELAAAEKVTLDDVRKFHDQFYGASSGVLAVVGLLDPAEVQKTAAELLGAWNTPMPFSRIDARFKKADPINEKAETPDKANAQFEAAVRFQMSDTDPDFPSMVLAGYMFGGTITSRISDRIRNREGLSYGANARIAVPTDGDAAILAGTISLNPVNGPKVEASFMDELRKTWKNGFTDAEVSGAKKSYLDARTVSRSQDGALASLLAQRELQGRTLQWDEQLEQRIQVLTPDQINAAFQKHIDPEAVSIVKAGDFKGARVY
jgi:zinc protease